MQSAKYSTIFKRVITSRCNSAEGLNLYKMILIDDLVNEDQTQEQVSVKVDGNLKYLSKSERKKMAKLVMDGKAIAVQYFTDLTEEQQEAYVKAKIKA